MLASVRSSRLTCRKSASRSKRTRHAESRSNPIRSGIGLEYRKAGGVHLHSVSQDVAQPDDMGLTGDLKLKFAIDRGGTFTDVFCEVLFLLQA